MINCNKLCISYTAIGLTVLLSIFMLADAQSYTLYNQNDIQYRAEAGDGSLDTGVHIYQGWYYDEERDLKIGTVDRGYALFYFNLDNIQLYVNRSIERVVLKFILEPVLSSSFVFNLYEPDDTWIDHIDQVYWWYRPEPLDDCIAESNPELHWNLPTSMEAELEFDITDIFQRWKNDPSSNNGIILLRSSSTGTESDVFTSESGNAAPLITVEYAPVPEPLSLFMVLSCLIGLCVKRWKHK